MTAPRPICVVCRCEFDDDPGGRVNHQQTHDHKPKRKE